MKTLSIWAMVAIAFIPNYVHAATVKLNPNALRQNGATPDIIPTQTQMSSVATLATAALPAASAGPLATLQAANAFAATIAALGYTPVTPAQSVINPWAGTGLGYTTAPSVTQLMSSLGAASVNGSNSFTGANTHSGLETFGSQTTFQNNSPPPASSLWLNTYFNTSINDPVAEAHFNKFQTQTNLTTGDDSNVPLTVFVTQFVNPNQYHYGATSLQRIGGAAGSHNGGIYGYTDSNDPLPRVETDGSLCGTGSELACPGSVYRLFGMMGYIGDTGSAEVMNGEGFYAHSIAGPSNLTVNGAAAGALGGVIDYYDSFYTDDGLGGYNAAIANGIVVSGNNYGNYSGFGTLTPHGMVDVQTQGLNPSATIWASGSQMWLATAPVHGSMSNAYAIVNGATFASSDGTCAGQVTGAALSGNGYLSYSVNLTATSCGTQSAPATVTFTEPGTGLFLHDTNEIETLIGFAADSTTINPQVQFGEIYDTTGVVGPAFEWKIGGTPIAFGWGAGGSRVAGLAIGFSSLGGFTNTNALSVNGNIADVTEILSGGRSVEASGSIGAGTGTANLSAMLQTMGKDTTSGLAFLALNSAGNNLFSIVDSGLSVAYGRFQVNDPVATSSEFLSPGAISAFSPGATGITGVGSMNLSTGSTDQYVAFNGFHACNKGGSLAEIVCDGPSALPNATSATHVTAVGYGVGTSVVAGSDDIYIGDSGNADTGADASHTFLLQGAGTTPIIKSTGINATPMTELYGLVTVGTSLAITSGGPTVTTSSGAPTFSAPAGSIDINTAGAAGTRIYIGQGGTSWIPISGV